MQSIRFNSPRLGAILVSALLLGACSDGVSVEVIEDTQFASSLEIDLTSMTRTASGLYVEQLEEGTGDPVGAGDRATVSYIGWLADGTVFDSGQFPFTVGAGQVVAGFDEGVDGLRLGGARRIVIPPALGYGDAGSGPVPPGAIMVFRIQLDVIG
jgi:FKBP-type peptidyl-prolyl cis-trans isomerase FkpA